MTDFNALLDKPFDELTPQEWALLRQSGDATSDEGSDHRASDLETRLAESVQDWEKFSRVISDILNS